MNLRTINRPKELTSYLESLDARRIQVIALDFEGEFNLHRYGEHLCLIQIYDGQEQVVIDPLAMKQTQPLIDLFEKRDLLKIMYDASSDSALVQHIYGVRLSSILDLRPAVTLLGFERQDLSSVLKEVLGREPLGKRKYQMYDWTRRPIDRAAMSYAMGDVLPLFELKERLFASLQEQGLMDAYLLQNLMVQNGPIRPMHQDRHARAKGYRHLDQTQQTRFKALFEIRDELAREADVPPHMLFPNQDLLELARRSKYSEQDSARIGERVGKRVPKSVRERLIERFGVVFADGSTRYLHIAELYDILFPVSPSDSLPTYLRRLAADHAAKIPDSPPLTLLDIGCGTGGLSAAIEPADPGSLTYTGIDLDRAMVTRARKLVRERLPDPSTLPNLPTEFIEMDMLDVGQRFAHGSFAVVTCVGNTLVHLPDEDSILTLLCGVFSLLRPGGEFILQILNYDHILDTPVTTLPIIDRGSVRMERSYRLTDSGHLEFRIELSQPESEGAGTPPRSTMHLLYPVRKHALLRLLRQAGFSVEGVYRSGDKEPLELESLPLFVFSERPILS